MLISLNWLKEFIDFSYTSSELDSILTMLGIEVEKIENFASKYEGFITAKVISKIPHPDADKLSLCSVEYNGISQTVVCGAPNVDSNQIVILGLSGATVPNGGFKLAKRKIRGIESNGMICSRAELDLDNDHSGIWVLPDDTELGISLVDYLNMNDTVFEVSLTPNKSECLSHLGIARELAAYLKKRVNLPVVDFIEDRGNISDSVSIKIDNNIDCPRYVARIVRNAKVKDSPDWLKNKLKLVGLRSINCVVDVTNLILIEQGQPLHAFDLDTLSQKKVVIKNAINGEKFTSLDSKERILDDKMLMICDGEKSIAIAGVMGGENSEINDNTTNIIIESAYFNPKSIRKTSKKLGIQSDASYRFERGVDIDNLVYCANRAAQLIAELTGGYIEHGLIDIYPTKIEEKKVTLRFQKATSLIGVEIPKEQILETLDYLNFTKLELNNESITVSVPNFRHDIDIEEDLIEEVARFFNYDNIAPDYSSKINFESKGTSHKLNESETKHKIMDYLSNSGFRQIYTQFQIDPNTSKIFSDNLIEIANPLGEELSIMRPSSTPQMLKVIHHNIRHGNKNLQLFEIGKSFHKYNSDKESFLEGITEIEELVIGLSGNALNKEWNQTERAFDFFDIKGAFEELCDYLKIANLTLSQFKEKPNFMSVNSLCVCKGKKGIGYIGLVHKRVLKNMDIDQDIFILNLNLTEIFGLKQKKWDYNSISQFPKIERDLAFLVASDVSSSDVENIIQSVGSNLLKKVKIFDVFSGKNMVENQKSLAYSLTFASKEKTLETIEVETLVNKIIVEVETKLNASLRK